MMASTHARKSPPGSSVGRLATALVQLLAIVAVLEGWNLETRATRIVAAIGVAGLILHQFLPERLRSAWFLGLSIAALGVVLGPTDAFSVIALGCILVGVARSGASYRSRVLAGVSLGIAFVALRTWGGPLPWSAALWPVLGSMFMFRWALFVRAPDRREAGWTESLGYFFLLPNVCFPLFPVVDWKAFRARTASDDESTDRGIARMTRGVLHLMAHRLVDHYVVIDSTAVDGPFAFLRWAVSTYLVYLRVSGQFHLAVGMITLFGRDLPPTHQRYFLADGFVDLWRRINIYWKDFMMKTVFYPVFFRLRRRSRHAESLATLTVFAASWALHVYQRYWITGTLYLAWHDLVFWLGLGVLVTLESRTPAGDRPTGWRAHAGRTLRTTATFGTLALLWSVWASPSFDDWTDAAAAAGVGWVALVAFVSVASFALARGLDGGPGGERPTVNERSGLRARSAALIALVLLALPSVQRRLPEAAVAVSDAVAARVPTVRWQQSMENGYYEQLNDPREYNRELWSRYVGRGAAWTPLFETSLWEPRADYLQGRLRPNASDEFRGHRWTNNRWGMRDRDYEMTKPGDVFRVALLGASHSAGSGVGDDQVFEALIERQLQVHSTGPRFEILNFSAPAHWVTRQVVVLERQALRFDPDAVVIVEHPGEERRAARDLARSWTRGIAVPDASVLAWIESLGIEENTPFGVAAPTLIEHGSELIELSVERARQLACDADALPVWLYLPIPDGRGVPDAERRRALSRATGLHIWDLSDIYSGHPIERMRAASWDPHPSPQAHRLLAAALEKRVAELPRIDSARYCREVTTPVVE